MEFYILSAVPLPLAGGEIWLLRHNRQDHYIYYFSKIASTETLHEYSL